MGDWTADAQIAVDLCLAWASEVQSCLPLELYLFGSAIYRGGEQFDPQQSDLDIVAVFADETAAGERVHQLQALQSFKADLESRMIPKLRRTSCTEPGASIVAMTPFEALANIHKSGSRRFFDKNFFLNLRTGQERLALTDAAGTATVRDENRYALEYVQKVRNAYLGKAANGKGGLAQFAGVDPMPKALLRFAAQLNADATNGEWYDTRQGLELLFDNLRDRRLDSPELRALFDKVSVRRGGRGRLQPLSDVDQLHLCELMYDLAAAVPVEELIVWELRFIKHGTFSDPEIARLRQLLIQLLPEATITDMRHGSLILKIRSSAGSFEVIRKLEVLGVLEKFFEVEHIDFRRIGGDGERTEPVFSDRQYRLYEWLLSWKPEKVQLERELEDSLEAWLRDGPGLDILNGAEILRDPKMSYQNRPFRPDLAIMWSNEDNRHEFLTIELMRLRENQSVISKLQSLLELPFHTFLVVVGDTNRLERLQRDVRVLDRLNGRVRIAFIPWHTENN